MVCFVATDVHAGAQQAARDALHRRVGMSRTQNFRTKKKSKNFNIYFLHTHQIPIN